jgi:predicted nucleic acid-binding protein
MRTYTLIVPDSSPLITLAMAGALDLLLRPGLKIIIPDGVHWEVARDANLAGATDIIEWMKHNPGQVVIYPTQEFANQQTLIAAGVKRVRGLGERCALEAVEDGVEKDPDARGILLYEDSDIRLLAIVNTDKIDTLTTADFLAELERAQLIQSADQILDQAVQAGRSEGIRRRSGT